MTRVLVVDDEPDLRLMLRMALEMAGHEVHEAECGAGALAALEDPEVEALVLDVHLPDMAGWEVLERLRSSPDRHALPTVVITADICQSRPNPRDDEAGGVRLVYKPLDPHDLVATVDAVVAATPSEREACT